MIATGQRLRQNAWGQYYVTDVCNGCGICAPYAGANFERSFDGSRYYLIQQPYDDWEEQAVLDAMEACPLHAIRDDG
jgi:ferredoxin